MGKPGPGKGKTNNPNGRPAGTQNKTTTEMKKILQQVIGKQLDNIEEALEEIREDDPARYMDILSKFIQYVMPRQTQSDITNSDGSMSVKPEIKVSSEEAKVALERMIHGSN